MTERDLIIRGAREHNLKNISLTIPRNKLVVVTGLSGSGKSSLAFDTIYAEGQRRYVESLSSYARQFLGQMEKPDVDRIEGLSPAISIEQKTTARNPRSTVGTMTEIYDYLRLLFARVGQPHCPSCGREISQQSIAQMQERILGLQQGSRVMVLSPIVRGRKGEHRKVLESVEKEGFVRVRINGEIVDVTEAPKLERQKKHNIDIVVDRLNVSTKNAKRIADSLETAARFSGGLVKVVAGGEETLFSQHYACPFCDTGFGELEPRMFSFNSPYGACESCGGLGSRMDINADLLVPDEELTLGEGALAYKPLGDRLEKQPFPFREFADRLLNWTLAYELNRPELLELISNAARAGGETGRKFERLHALVTGNRSYALLEAIEAAKLRLSDTAQTRIVLEDLDIDANSILFFDDNPLNVDAARAAGWHAERVQGPDAVRAQLERYGLLPAGAET